MNESEHYIIINCEQGIGFLEKNVMDKDLQNRLIYWRNNFPYEMESSIYSVPSHNI